MPAFVEHMTAGQPSLLHGGAGQRREPDDVTSGVDVGNRGLEVLIHPDFSAAIGSQAGGLDVHLIAVCLTPDGVEEPLSVNIFAAFEPGKDTIALLVEPDRDHLLAQAKHRAQLA